LALFTIGKKLHINSEVYAEEIQQTYAHY